MPARGGEEKPGLFHWIHTLPGFLDPPEPGWNSFCQNVASVVVVDHAEASAEDGQSLQCSSGLGQGPAGLQGDFLGFTHAETLCQETVCGTHVP